MAEDIELAWRLSVSGAEEVKAKISDLHDQFNRGEIDVAKYSKGLRSAGSEYRALSSHTDLATKQFLAQHPAIASMSRGLSGLNSVLRTTVAVTAAMNLATIAMQGTQSNILTLESELAAAKREYNKAVAEGDVEGQEDGLDRIAIAEAKLKEAMQQTATQSIITAVTVAASFALMGSSVLTSWPKIVGGIGHIITALRALTAAQIIAAATNPYLLLAVGVAIAAALIILYWDDIVAALTSAWEWITATFGPAVTAIWESLSNAMLIAGTAIISVWNQHIVPALAAAWATIQAGFTGFVNGIITVANFLIGAIAAGIEGYINGVISGINALISVYNNAARAVGAGTIDTVGNISIAAPQIPLIKAAGGFNGIVSRPTLMMVGEGGASERVFVGPTGGGPSGGHVTIIKNYHIHGSVWTTRDLRRELEHSDIEDLRSRGIRGDD